MKRRQSWWSSTCKKLKRARKTSKSEARNWKHKRRPTICYWEPSVLFFDLEFVCETLRLCSLTFSIHRRLRVVVRRLHSRFHVRLLWGGRRHVYSVACRHSSPRVTPFGPFVCWRLAPNDLLSTTSLRDRPLQRHAICRPWPDERPPARAEPLRNARLVGQSRACRVRRWRLGWCDVRCDAREVSEQA